MNHDTMRGTRQQADPLALDVLGRVRAEERSHRGLEHRQYFAELRSLLATT
jgi:hypothetical protein